MAIINANTGGVLDTAATDPLTVDAGVTVDGATPTNLGALDTALAALGNVPLGSGVTTPIANADVTNDGTITGVGSDADLKTALQTLAPTVANAVQPIASGVEMLLGGTVTNDAAGMITGAQDGVYNAANAAVVTNAGLIDGGAGAGVDLLGGGTVNNTGSSTTGGGIAGVTAGVSIAGSPANTPSNVTNSGTISASDGPGVTVDLGNVDNAAGGSISSTGAGNVGVMVTGTGTVTNAGTIAGTAGANGTPAVAVELQGADSTLTLDAGQTLTGMAVATPTATDATLELAAGNGAANTVADVGNTITGFANMVVDSGVAGTVTNGLGDAAGQATDVALKGDDSLTVGGPVAANVTIGTANSTGSAITLSGPVAQGADVDLSGTDAKLTLADPTAFAGTVANLGAGDVLDLTGLAQGTKVSLGGNGLTITNPNGTTASLAVPLPANASLSLDPTGTGVSLGVGLGGTSATVTVGGTTGTGTTGTGTTGTGTTGGTSTLTPLAAGQTGLTTTTASGTTSTQTIPAGSAMAVGSGSAAGDVISVDPSARLTARGTFTITGHVAAPSGVGSVTITAQVDKGQTVTLGQAKVAADGSYSFTDKVGPHLQGFITATAVDSKGGSVSALAPFSLQAGIGDKTVRAQEALYSPDGGSLAAFTNYHPGGSSKVAVDAGSQVFDGGPFRTFENGGQGSNTFVFNEGEGLNVIDGFRIGGNAHDTVSLPSADFQSFADVLNNTTSGQGGVTIHNPTTGDTIKLAGVTMDEMTKNQGSFTFHK